MSILKATAASSYWAYEACWIPEIEAEERERVLAELAHRREEAKRIS